MKAVRWVAVLAVAALIQIVRVGHWTPKAGSYPLSDAVGGQLADPNTSMAITVTGRFTANPGTAQFTALHVTWRERTH